MLLGIQQPIHAFDFRSGVSAMQTSRMVSSVAEIDGGRFQAMPWPMRLDGWSKVSPFGMQGDAAGSTRTARASTRRASALDDPAEKAPHAVMLGSLTLKAPLSARRA
jgi:hypothetical protein